MKRRGLVLSALSGLLLGLAFPNRAVAPLAWVALVPLFLSLSSDALSPRRSFLHGFVAFFLADLIIFYWLLPTFTIAKIGAVTTAASWLALSAIVALYGGVLAVVYAAVRSPWARPFVAAAAWVVLEEIRSVALTGFPWALLSHTQARVPAVIQIAAITGGGGVSFLLLSTNAGLAGLIESLRHGDKRARGAFALSALLAIAAVGGGALRLRRSSATVNASGVSTISVLQGNIDQYRKWDDAYEADIRRVYEGLARKAALDKPALVVWPETAVPGWIPKDPFYTQWVAGIASTTAVPQLVGALAASERGEFNAAFLFASDGRIAERYEKQHLVPFGEYLPFGGFLRNYVPYLGQLGTFDAGHSFVHFDSGALKVAPNICYEMMFPDLVRTSARGADVIVNITNDGWFLKTSAPEQHFAVNFFRAVENGKPVVRAANTGISAFIDGYGRVIAESPLLVEGVYTARVPTSRRDAATPFGKFGNWFGYACGAVTLAWLAAAIVGKRNRRADPI